MATMGSALGTGMAVKGQGSKAKRNRARLVGLSATVALGLSLVAGGLLGQARQSEQRATLEMRAAAPAGILSGGSYADLVWELEQAPRAATYGSAPAAQGGMLSGGSYLDLVWELEQAAR